MAAQQAPQQSRPYKLTPLKAGLHCALRCCQSNVPRCDCCIQPAPHPSDLPSPSSDLQGWAAEVHGLDLKEDLNPALVEQIKQDVTE